MPVRVQNITSDAYQRHTLLLPESEVTLTLRFLPRVQCWMLDAAHRGRAVFGVKVSVGVLHIRSQNQPFDFACRDLSGNGIDPFRRIDFSSGRCELYMLEPADMVKIRGDEVPL